MTTFILLRLFARQDYEGLTDSLKKLLKERRTQYAHSLLSGYRKSKNDVVSKLDSTSDGGDFSISNKGSVNGGGYSGNVGLGFSGKKKKDSSTVCYYREVDGPGKESVTGNAKFDISEKDLKKTAVGNIADAYSELTLDAKKKIRESAILDAKEESPKIKELTTRSLNKKEDTNNTSSSKNGKKIYDHCKKKDSEDKD